MNNIKEHKELQELSKYVYKERDSKLPIGWLSIKPYENKDTGFYAEAFYKNDKVVIAIRGTDMGRGRSELGKDGINDLNLSIKGIPAQYSDAEKFYSEIKKTFPNQEIIFTGHSLGGSLSQILGSQFGEKAVTFNAFGVGDTYSPKFKYTKNIVNYGNPKDIVFTSNIDNQLGKTYMINDTESKEDYREQAKFTTEKYLKKYHTIQSMGDISNVSEYKGQNVQTEESKAFKLNIEKNVDMRDVDPFRYYTREDVAKMSTDEYQEKENHILRQIKNIGMLTDKEAKNKLQTGDLIWVNSYVRDDGTEVKGYYRHK